MGLVKYGVSTSKIRRFNPDWEKEKILNQDMS